ncbi:MAG: alpha/beta hydrolase, partial [Alkalispirochaeta sp.]
MERNAIVEDFFTGADGRRLYVRHLEPSATRGVVVIVHGYGEHSARYFETMERFAAAGFAVYCPDLRGFG